MRHLLTTISKLLICGEMRFLFVLALERLVRCGTTTLTWVAFLVPPPKISDVLKHAVFMNNKVCPIIGRYAAQNGNLVLEDKTESLSRNVGNKLPFYAV